MIKKSPAEDRARAPAVSASAALAPGAPCPHGVLLLEVDVGCAIGRDTGDPRVVFGCLRCECGATFAFERVVAVTEHEVLLVVRQR